MDDTHQVVCEYPVRRLERIETQMEGHAGSLWESLKQYARYGDLERVDEIMRDIEELLALDQEGEMIVEAVLKADSARQADAKANPTLTFASPFLWPANAQPEELQVPVVNHHERSPEQ